MAALPNLPVEIPQGLADQVQGATEDATLLRSLHFSKHDLFGIKRDKCVFRLQQTGEVVSAGLYNLWSNEKGRMIESRRATNASLYYLVIRGAQYQEPVLVAKTPEYPHLCVWRGIEFGFDTAGLIIREDPAAAPEKTIPSQIAPNFAAHNEIFRPASRFPGIISRSAPPAPATPNQTFNYGARDPLIEQRGSAPSVARSEQLTIIEREGSQLAPQDPGRQDQHDHRDAYLIEDTPAIIPSIEQNDPLIKREPSVQEIVGPLRAPSTPASQFKPAPQIIFHFLDAAGNRRRSRALESIPNSTALFANVRAANPHVPLDDLNTVFARVTGSEEMVPLVKRDDEDWEALMNLVEVQKGVEVVEVEIRAAL